MQFTEGQGSFVVGRALTLIIAVSSRFFARQNILQMLSFPSKVALFPFTELKISSLFYSQKREKQEIYSRSCTCTTDP